MNDYSELIEQLRELTESCDILEGFINAPTGEYHSCKYVTHITAALNALEALAAENKALRNENCIKCGRYKTAHKGSCDGCRWHQKGD